MKQIMVHWKESLVQRSLLYLSGSFSTFKPSNLLNTRWFKIFIRQWCSEEYRSGWSCHGLSLCTYLLLVLIKYTCKEQRQCGFVGEYNHKTWMQFLEMSGRWKKVFTRGTQLDVVHVVIQLSCHTIYIVRHCTWALSTDGGRRLKGVGNPLILKAFSNLKSKCIWVMTTWRPWSATTNGRWRICALPCYCLAMDKPIVDLR